MTGRIFRKADRRGRIGLGIAIDEKGGLLGGGETCGEVDGRGCLSDSTFLVGDRDDSCQDRMSTRLHSSHVATSSAVFCLKKKIVAYAVRSVRFLMIDIQACLV